MDKEREISLLLEQLMQEKQESKRLREALIDAKAELAQFGCALRVIARNDGVYGAEEFRLIQIARAALGEEK